MKGLSPGAAFVFLMAAPVTSIASMTVIGKALGKRTLFIYLVNIIASTILLGLAVDYLLPESWFADKINHGIICNSNIENISIFKSVCSVTLAALLINAYIQKKKTATRSKCKSCNCSGKIRI